jgi:hypothetical protein
VGIIRASGQLELGNDGPIRVISSVFKLEPRPERHVVDPYLSNRRKFGKMTKSKKALIAGAALAGLLAGTTPTIQASNTLSGLNSRSNAQDQKADNKVKEKHGCKGQNSCKGKGGCATDGSKPPADVMPPSD